ncbi:hypothetical protein RFM26_23025, partial [Mesorhizobium sp. VK23B]
KHVLGQIDTKSDSLHDGRSPPLGFQHDQLGTFDAARGRPPIILWRSKEQSDAAQTIGSIP